MVDKTYFRGVSDVLTTIQQSERGSTSAARWIDKTSGSLLPFSSAFNTVRRFTDPVTREVNSPWEAVEARIAGLSSTLPPARDLWGTERKPQEVYGRVYDVISPVAVSARKDSPIDSEIARLRTAIKRIDKRGEFLGAEVNFRDFPHVYDEYVRLAGNELKHPAWGLGAKDLLDAVASGTHSLSGVYELYSDGPEGGKASFIKNTVQEYRKLAQVEIMRDVERFPDFVSYITQRGAQKRQDKFQLSPEAMGGATPDFGGALGVGR